jgi:hypothetical protein
MAVDEEYSDGMSFDCICPNCGVGNPVDADNCVVCDKDLVETVLFVEDEFYDIEMTGDEFVEYRKNFYRTRRTGKVKRYRLADMKKLEFGYPITRFSFEYHGRTEVYALKEENYNLLKRLMEKMGMFCGIESV